MTADLLRRAAAKLREHAEAATPGPWVTERLGDTWIVLKSQAQFDYPHQAEVADVHTPDERWPDYDYMACVHPPVALALADVFESLAGRMTTAGACRDQRLEAVAHAVLREDGERQ